MPALSVAEGRRSTQQLSDTAMVEFASVNAIGIGRDWLGRVSGSIGRCGDDVDFLAVRSTGRVSCSCGCGCSGPGDIRAGRRRLVLRLGRRRTMKHVVIAPLITLRRQRDRE